MWIYGGGFWGGTTTLDLYDLRTIVSEENVIAVGINVVTTMTMIMDNGHRWESSTELLPLPSSTSTQRMCRAMQVAYHLQHIFNISEFPDSQCSAILCPVSQCHTRAGISSFKSLTMLIQYLFWSGPALKSKMGIVCPNSFFHFWIFRALV